MSWAYLDDQSTFHAKVVSAGNGAWGACCRMITWSMAHLTDGKVPSRVAKLIASDDELADLIRVELVHELEDGAVLIHDFLDWNDSAKEIRKKREAKRKAGKTGGLRSGAARKQNSEHPPKQNGSNNEAPASRLVEEGANPLSLSLSLSEERERERAPDEPEPQRPEAGTKTPVVPDTPIPDRCREIATTIAITNGYEPDLALEWPHFLAHHKHVGTVTADLSALWQSWLVTGAKRARMDRDRHNRGSPPPPPAKPHPTRQRIPKLPNGDAA
jgi:hypothetical protein